MLTSIAGLPAHPLLVHLSVVAVPVGSLLLLTLALVARWRGRLGTITAVVGAVAFFASLLAKSTGESLLPAMGLSEHSPGPVGQHAQYADLLVVGAGLTFAIAALLYAVERWVPAARFGQRGTVLLILRIVAVPIGIFTLVMTVLTGHAGAELVWGTFPN